MIWLYFQFLIVLWLSTCAADADAAAAAAITGTGNGDGAAAAVLRWTGTKTTNTHKTLTHETLSGKRQEENTIRYAAAGAAAAERTEPVYMHALAFRKALRLHGDYTLACRFSFIYLFVFCSPISFDFDCVVFIWFRF